MPDNPNYVTPAWLVGNVAYSDNTALVQAINNTIEALAGRFGTEDITGTTNASGAINLTTALDLPLSTPILSAVPVDANATYYAILLSTGTTTFCIVRKSSDNTAVANTEVKVRVTWMLN